MRWNSSLLKRWRFVVIAICLLLMLIGYIASSALVSPTPADSNAGDWRVVSISPPPPKYEPFAALPEGDALIVRLHSSGCFHDSKYEFTFRHESEFTVSIVQLPSKVSRPGGAIEESARKELGSLILTQADAEGLDRLMESYHHQNRDRGCTSVVRIDFIRQRNGETVATEQFEDSSCEFGKMKDVTSFWQLIDRAMADGDD